MAGWQRRLIGDIAFHQANIISWLPGVLQAFTTRKGGLSAKPYDSLNMSRNAGDLADAVEENRRRAAAALSTDVKNWVFAGQVHGAAVRRVESPANSPVENTDALITNRPGVVLAMLFADCVPVYIVDPHRRAIGLAHSGLRGTAANVAGAAISAMRSEFGCNPSTCLAAIGPCISVDRYEVGRDVVEALAPFSGVPGAVMPCSELRGTFMLNLRAIVYHQLIASGLRPESVAVSDACSYRNRSEFFSHRRDAATAGATGRMAALLGIR